MRDCPHGNSIPDDVVSHLPPSQAGGGRHKCAVCSYAQGRGYSRGSAGLEECAHGSGAPVDVLASLPDYQGQPTRHMCATCAFAEGQANESRDTPETAASPPEVADAQVTLEERAGRQSGQRYQESVEVRQAIERRAMRWARERLEADGWSVTDVSARESYDFHCERDSEELHVEVKGTQSDGRQVLLTKNEVAHARSNFPHVALYILAQVDVSEDSGRVEASGGEESMIEPWRVDDGSLEPLGYSYTVPTEDAI